MVPRCERCCPVRAKWGTWIVTSTCRKLTGWCLAIATLAASGLASSGPVSDPFHQELLTHPAQEVSPGEFELAAQKRLKKRKKISDPSLPRAGSSGRVYGRQAFKWFWREVSPSRNAASAKRWATVLNVIDSGRKSGKPVYGSRSMAQRIAQNFGDYLKRESKRRNVSIPFLIAVIAVESNGNPKAKSPVGARGLMQLMPPTAARFGVSNSYAPSQNIRGGAHYLDWLLRRYRNDAVLALAGYNAGEGAVDRHKGVPPYRETRDYVAKVAGAFSVARYLCKKPPNSPREPCELR